MKVIVQMHQGSVSMIQQPPGVEVEVRDYDIPDDWEGDIHTDDEGDKYERHVFAAPEPDVVTPPEHTCDPPGHMAGGGDDECKACRAIADELAKPMD